MTEASGYIDSQRPRSRRYRWLAIGLFVLVLLLITAAIRKGWITTAIEEFGWDSLDFGIVWDLFRILWWWLLLAALLVALIASLAWYLRQISLRRLPVPTFVLVALIIHLLIGTSSFFFYFGGQIVTRVKQDWKQVSVVLASEDEHQSHEPGHAAYEKVADLEHVKTIKPQEDRQILESPNVPVPPQTPAPICPRGSLAIRSSTGLKPACSHRQPNRPCRREEV